MHICCAETPTGYAGLRLMARLRLQSLKCWNERCEQQPGLLWPLKIKCIHTITLSFFFFFFFRKCGKNWFYKLNFILLLTFYGENFSDLWALERFKHNKTPWKSKWYTESLQEFFAHVAHPGFKAIDKFVTLFSKKLFNSVFNKP